MKLSALFLITSLTAAYVLALAAACWLLSIPGPIVKLSIVLGAFLVVLSWIDARHGILPDHLTFPLIALGLISSWWLNLDPLYWRIISAIAAAGIIVAINLIYRKLRNVDGIGYGDAKLLAASGAWLGLLALPTVVIWACATGLIQVLIMARRGAQVSGTTTLAFGPHLAFGTWLTWLFGALG